MSGREPRQQRGLDRQAAVVAGAVTILNTVGPSGISARAIAAAGQVPLSAITYYFDSLDEIVGAAAQVVVAEWLQHGMEVAKASASGKVKADRVSRDRSAARTITEALLPPGGVAAVRTRYEHLVAAGRVQPVATALAGLRPQLLELIDQIRTAAGVDLQPSANTVLAVLDGAALGAISEGDPQPRVTVENELRQLFSSK